MVALLPAENPVRVTFPVGDVAAVNVNVPNASVSPALKLPSATCIVLVPLTEIDARSTLP